MKRSRTYPASTISDDTKTVLAKLYVVEGEEGRTKVDFVNNLSKIGLIVSASQFGRWVAKTNTNGSAISLNKLTGPEALLDREQRDVASGWVLDQNDNGEPVHLATYCSFVSSSFDINISEMTASRYLKDDGFAYRTMQTKGKSFVVDVERMRAGAWEWHQSHDFTSFDTCRDSLCSIDFTFTSHRTDRPSGFAPKGG